MAIYECSVCFQMKDDDYEPPVSLVGYDLVCPDCEAEHEEDKENNSEY